MPDTSWLSQLQDAVPTGQNARFYNAQAARIRALDQIDPTLAQIPGGLIGASSLSVDDQNFYDQVSNYSGAKAAQASRTQFETYAPGMQRVLWDRMDDTQKQALQASGYQAPQNPAPDDGGFLGAVGKVAGSALSLPTEVIGKAISPVLEPLSEIGQIPADMYRAIRTQPEWVQQIALAAGVAAGAAAVVATGGTALPFVGTAFAGASPVFAGAGASLAGGFAAAGIVNSLQGNPDFWGKAFQWGDAGERTWDQATIDKARGLINSNGNVLELAKTLAFKDPLDLIEQFGSQQGSQDLDTAQKSKMAEDLSLKAGPYQSQEQQTAYSNLLTLMDDPQFNAAVKTLRQGKISPGRDFASLLGLDEGDTGYNFISGVTDATFQVITDPTLIAGRVLKISRGARYGMQALADASDAAGITRWVNRVDAVAERPQVQRAWSTMADNLGKGDYDWLYRQMPGTRELLPDMLNWQRKMAPGAEWDTGLVHDFFRSKEAAYAIGSGGAMSSKHGLLEMPHLNPIQAKLSNARAQFTGAIDFLDSANINFRWTGPNEAAAPEYSLYQHLNTGTKIAVNILDGVPILKTVAEGGATLAKSFMQYAPKDGFVILSQDTIAPDQIRNFDAFSEMWRVAGVPADVRGELFNKMVGAGSAAQRRSVIDHFYSQTFDHAGLWSTAEGKEMGDQFINRVHQALIGGTEKAVFENHGATMLAIPDMKELRRAVSKQTVLDHLLNAADTQAITAAMSNVWKPAVLLRIGFIPRILGDEFLSFVARMGLKSYVAGHLGLVAGGFERSSLQEGASRELVAHARGLEAIGRVLNGGVHIASFGKVEATGLDELLHNQLLRYSEGIRSYARHGIISDSLKETGFGKMLTNPNTFHGLLLGGVGEDGRYALSFIKDPKTLNSVMSQVSGHQANIIGELPNAEAQRQFYMLSKDKQIEQAMLINPKNTRQRVDGLTGEGMSAQWRNQMETWNNQSVQNIWGNWAVHNPSPVVTDTLDQIPDFLPRLNQVKQKLDQAERDALSIIATDNKNMIPALRDAATHYAQMGDKRLVKIMAKAKTREDVIQAIDKMGPRAKTAMAEIRPMLEMDGGFKGWLGNAIQEPIDITATRYSSEAAHRVALTELNKPYHESSEFQAGPWSKLDVSKKIQGIPVARPVDEGLPRMFMPYGDNINPVLDQLGELPNLTPEVVRQAFKDAGNTLIDEDTASAIARMASNRKVATARGWMQDGPYAASMLTGDPELTKKVSDAFSRVAKEPGSSIVEVPSHRELLGGLRANHGIPWASDPVRFSERTQGYFLDLKGMDRDFIVHGPDVPVIDGKVGLTTDQAIERYGNEYVNGFYDVYAAPRSGFPDPGDVTVKGDGTTKIAEGPHHTYRIEFENRELGNEELRQAHANIGAKINEDLHRVQDLREEDRQVYEDISAQMQDYANEHYDGDINNIPPDTYDYLKQMFYDQHPRGNIGDEIGMAEDAHVASLQERQRLETELQKAKLKPHTSAPVEINGDTIKVDPKRAELDLAAGSPYLNGNSRINIPPEAHGRILTYEPGYENATEGEPLADLVANMHPVQEGYTRLWRGTAIGERNTHAEVQELTAFREAHPTFQTLSGTSKKFDKERALQQGRWFTKEPDYAAAYPFTEHGPNELMYIDVPSSYLDEIGMHPNAGGAGASEYVISPEYADRARLAVRADVEGQPYLTRPPVILRPPDSQGIEEYRAKLDDLITTKSNAHFEAMRQADLEVQRRVANGANASDEWAKLEPEIAHQRETHAAEMEALYDEQDRVVEQMRGERIALDDIPIKPVKGSTFNAEATTDINGRPVIHIDEDNIKQSWASMRQAYEEGKVPPSWWRKARSEHTNFFDFMDNFQDEGQFRQFVIEHERGHMANHHAWTQKPEPGEEYTKDWVNRETQADDFAYNQLGMSVPTRDTRSIRISRALDQAGVDPNQVVQLMSTNPKLYPEFLADLEANRLRNGDTLEGDLAAVEAMVSKYQLPHSGLGTIRPPLGAGEPRLLWGTMGPKTLEEKLPFRTRLADPTDVTRIAEADHPRQAVQTVLAAVQEQGKLQNMVNWGFNKVSVAQDAILRNPMAMGTYVKIRRDMQPLEQVLLDPQHFGDAGGIRQLAREALDNDTRIHWTQLNKTQQKQLVQAGRILQLDYSPRVAEVAQRVGGSTEAANYLRGEGHEALADLVSNVKATRSVDDQVKEFMQRAENQDYEWAPENMRSQAVNAHKNWDMVNQQVHDMAMQRTVRDMAPFIDDHRVRVQFQQYANNIVPFWYAEDQFMRRWARTFVYDPTVIRKAQLLHEGLKSTGFIQTDSQGNDIYIVPGSTAFAETVAKLPFLHDSVPITSAITGQLSLTLPGLNRFGQPSASPLIGLPLQQLSTILPEIRPISDAFTGGQSDKGILRSLVPSHIMRFVDAVTANDNDRVFASAMKTAAQVLEANGYGLKDNATIGEQETYLERLRNHARTILITQALFGFLSPAPPNVVPLEGDKPGSLATHGSLLGIGESVATLRPEYLDLVRNLGVEAGTAKFLEKYPDTTPDDLVNRNIAYSKGFSETQGRAPVPPTQQATDWYRTNQEWAKQYPYASAWMMPPAPDRETALDVNMNVFREQQAMGLRKDLAPTDYVNNLKFAAASPEYFDKADQFDAMIDGAKTPQGRKTVQAQKSLWTQQYLSTHPWFAQQLTSGEAKSRRGSVLDELRIALNDPASPDAWHLNGMRDMLAAYDKYLLFNSSLAGKSDVRSTKARAHAKITMEDWGTAYVADHPELSSFWSGIIKPEVG